MEPILPEAAQVSGGIVAPKIPPAAARTPFSATRAEQIAAFLMYVLAYVYIECCRGMLSDMHALLPRILLAVFTLGFIGLTAYLHRGTPRAGESLIWLGCTLVILASVVLDRGSAWDAGMPFVFLHIFAVWWALSRSDALLGGESGLLLPLDALNGFFALPLTHLALRIRTVIFCCAQLRGTRKKRGAETMVRTGLITAAALWLFATALHLLTVADDGFSALFAGFWKLFSFNWRCEQAIDILIRVLFSLPVGAYLYGLLAGTLRADKPALRAQGATFGEKMRVLRGVSDRVWLALLALFCALYALFFAVQGRYLFGAFTRTLPDGFVVSQYARQGFFELCKVMTVNFALLWLVTRSSKTDVREQKATRALCLVLLAESLLLAVVAFSKLALYIDCFGFTPRRLQSTWLVCVLSFGALCAVWTLLRGAKTFRVWMAFGAVTLSLLCLY